MDDDDLRVRDESEDETEEVDDEDDVCDRCGTINPERCAWCHRCAVCIGGLAGNEFCHGCDDGSVDDEELGYD